MAFVTSFQEHEDSPQEGGDRTGTLSMTRIFLTAWADRWLFINELFTSGPFGLPASYSTYWPGVLADTFKIDKLISAPVDVTITDPNFAQLAHDTLAKITVTYSPLPLDQQQSDPDDTPLPDGTFATYSQEATTEFRSLPGRACYWESDGVTLPPDVTPVIVDMLTTHTITWNQVRNVPWVTLGNLKGKVNSAVTRLPGSPQRFAAETLLFEGFSDETTLNFFDQNPSRKLTLKFVEKAQHALTTSTVGGAGTGTVYGWNHQFREDTRLYDKPVSDTATPMFQTANFNTLWTATV